jgi:hypothetical protein
VKKDAEVQFYMRERQKGTSQQLAAARAGMSERTCIGYQVHPRLKQFFCRLDVSRLKLES